MSVPSGPRLRQARPGEAAELSALCLRSKAHWGYDAAFLAACVPALTVSAAMIAAGQVLVAADAGDRPLGVAALSHDGAAVELLFVDPAAMGQGIGRALLAALVQRARAQGRDSLAIAADPGAEAFYLRQGAVRVGWVESEVLPGRRLPLLGLALGSACPRPAPAP